MKIPGIYIEKFCKKIREEIFEYETSQAEWLFTIDTDIYLFENTINTNTFSTKEDIFHFSAKLPNISRIDIESLVTKRILKPNNELENFDKGLFLAYFSECVQDARALLEKTDDAQKIHVLVEQLSRYQDEMYDTECLRAMPFSELTRNVQEMRANIRTVTSVYSDLDRTISECEPFSLGILFDCTQKNIGLSLCVESKKFGMYADKFLKFSTNILGRMDEYTMLLDSCMELFNVKGKPFVVWSGEKYSDVYIQ